MRPLSVTESQRIFRAVLDALARPGTLGRLPGIEDCPAPLLPLLVLADLSTPVSLLGSPSGQSREGEVRALTSAPVTGVSEARLVTALRPMTADELASVRTGTAEAPEEGALVTLAVNSFTPNGSSLQLTGPGVSGAAELSVDGLPSGFTEARRALTEAFPAGADFLLVAPDGRIAGLPRTTVVSAERVPALWVTPASRAGWTPSSPPSASSAASASSPRGCRRGTS